ncbi:hypothetical protein Hanom_Chr07g00638331 [Helianthus anomalus]
MAASDDDAGDDDDDDDDDGEGGSGLGSISETPCCGFWFGCGSESQLRSTAGSGQRFGSGLGSQMGSGQQGCSFMSGSGSTCLVVWVRFWIGVSRGSCLGVTVSFGFGSVNNSVELVHLSLVQASVRLT